MRVQLNILLLSILAHGCIAFKLFSDLLGGAHKQISESFPEVHKLLEDTKVHGLFDDITKRLDGINLNIKGQFGINNGNDNGQTHTQTHNQETVIVIVKESNGNGQSQVQQQVYQNGQLVPQNEYNKLPVPNFNNGPGTIYNPGENNGQGGSYNNQQYPNYNQGQQNQNGNHEATYNPPDYGQNNQKPNDDKPLQIPLNPNQYQPGNPKEVTGPKREALVDQEETFEIDERFGDIAD